jgi:hypothetical protein
MNFKVLWPEGSRRESDYSNFSFWIARMGCYLSLALSWRSLHCSQHLHRKWEGAGLQYLNKDGTVIKLQGGQDSGQKCHQPPYLEKLAARRGLHPAVTGKKAEATCSAWLLALERSALRVLPLSLFWACPGTEQWGQGAQEKSTDPWPMWNKSSFPKIP